MTQLTDWMLIYLIASEVALDIQLRTRSPREELSVSPEERRQAKCDPRRRDSRICGAWSYCCPNVRDIKTSRRRRRNSVYLLQDQRCFDQRPLSRDQVGIGRRDDVRVSAQEERSRQVAACMGRLCKLGCEQS